MGREDGWAVLSDAVAVVAFVVIGRASHGEGEGLLGVLRTLWPFGAGMLVGWAVLVGRSLPGTRVQAGPVVGGFAALLGLALRALSGQGVAFSFAIVALVVLTAFMVGWRAVARILRR